MSDQYKTIATEAIGEFRDRGSKFTAYAYSVNSEAEWQARLEEVKKLHPKARHHCFAFRLGMDKNNFRANDDGEPSGTAGRPILGQIDSCELTNIIVIVIRYFGGTKLGVPGLINAYKTAAAEALQAATIITKTIKKTVSLDFDYAIMSDVMNAVKKLELEITSQDFTDKGYLKIAIPKSEIESTLDHLKAQILKVSLEEAQATKTIDGLTIQIS